MASHSEQRHEKPKRFLATPLGIIGGFLSITEVALAVVAGLTSGSIQWLIALFAVLFPFAVAALFFLILWKRNYVLYPPEAYKRPSVNDFVNAMRSGVSTDLYGSVQSAVRDGVQELLGTQLKSQTFEKTLSKQVANSDLVDDATDRIMKRVTEEAFVAVEFDERLFVLGPLPVYLPYDASATTAQFLSAIMRILNATLEKQGLGLAMQGEAGVKQGLGLAMQHTRSSHDPVSCCPSLRLTVE